ncbi:Nif3-like dinuclear metal center hexameric protein [Carboxylicivirga linearis]|uniref:GTP cyclohydrolase 1 type 2 homolog n=1 Tax=Carboxylicivirga linearis TaxID=1628157 RepID=A0ABS5JSN3_9BACT|nr:Nif3-like dinuclear metal center hexameric protein [Carboxylicivirga linearis]MBS2097926.1 Nif3-like dinuclear metal center hexameric protein [Carboxylicivirga linearis]
MSTVRDVMNEMERFAPSALKEDFDNVGLLLGDANAEVKGVLVTLDITEKVIDEAIQNECNMIVSHHPIMLSGLKKITGKNDMERVVLKSIKNDIAIYASHTNADSVMNGVSGRMCKKLKLKKCKILSPKKESLVKLVVFVPVNHAEELRKAIFEAGAGVIGEYDSCSFNVIGQGTFKAGETTDPFVGKKGELHREEEVRIETIMPSFIEKKVVGEMIKAHPYEEVAYDIYPLRNQWATAGIGMIGELEYPVDELDFLNKVKEEFKVGCIRHTNLLNKKVKKVAVCGGSGSFLLGAAIAQNADVFITGDFKYHQFFDAEEQIIIADIGHFESEQYTKEVFFELLTKKFSNFAVRLSKENTNPVNYL